MRSLIRVSSLGTTVSKACEALVSEKASSSRSGTHACGGFGEERNIPKPFEVRSEEVGEVGDAELDFRLLEAGLLLDGAREAQLEKRGRSGSLRDAEVRSVGGLDPTKTHEVSRKRPRQNRDGRYDTRAILEHDVHHDYLSAQIVLRTTSAPSRQSPKNQVHLAVAKQLDLDIDIRNQSSQMSNRRLFLPNRCLRHEQINNHCSRISSSHKRKKLRRTDRPPQRP